MKKIILALALVSIVFSSGCRKDTPENESAENTGKNGYSFCLLWESAETGADVAEVSYDIDGDGKDDEIRIIKNDGSLKIEALDKAYTCDGIEINLIEKVYGLDLDADTPGNQIAVITDEWSDDGIIRIFDFGEDIAPIGFAGDDEEDIRDFTGVGYDREISVTGKNVITSSCRGSYGMWSLGISYELYDGVFHKIEQEEREVVYPSYRLITDYQNEEELLEYGYISGDEEYKSLTEKGMALAAADYDPAGGRNEGDGIISLKKGEYFKVTKENKDGRIYIVKDNGEEGYIDRADWTNNGDKVSFVMFFLAD